MRFFKHMEEKIKRYIMLGILLAILCRALFPYPLAHSDKHEVISITKTSYPGYEDDAGFSLVSYITDKNYSDLLLSFPDWESEEAEDDDDIWLDSFDRDIIDIGLFAVKKVIPKPFNFRIRSISLFILFHSWKHFLS